LDTDHYQQISPSVPGSGLAFTPLGLRLNAFPASKLSLPTKVDRLADSGFEFPGVR
jgi:hypothetical protein